MSDVAARFERDLEARASGRAPAPGGDAAALAVAGRLAGADLAAESRVKESLRVRLLARARRQAPGCRPPWRFRLPAGLAGALAAAAIVLLLLRPRAPAPPTLPAPAMMVRESSRPASRRPLPAGAAARPRTKRLTARAEGVFLALPAGSPFEARRPVSGGSPFMTVTGHRTDTPRGRAVVWELDGATYMLEDRSVRIEDLFVKPTL